MKEKRKLLASSARKYDDLRAHCNIANLMWWAINGDNARYTASVKTSRKATS